MSPSLHCPICQSVHVVTRNWGCKTIGAIGAAAGATRGFVGALRGAQVGTAAGLVVGPAGSAVGGITGAILGGLAGSVVGCEMGSAAGKTLDIYVFNNYRCKSCKYTFTLRQALLRSSYFPY